MRRALSQRLARAGWLALALAALSPAAHAQAPGGELYARIGALLAERSDEPIARIELPPEGALCAEAAAPGVQISLTMATARTKPGANAVSVRLERGGAVLRRAVVNARVSMMRELVVAARPLRAGATLAESDVTLAMREFDAPRGDELTELNAALGQRLGRHLGEGEPLRAAWLAAVPRVRRGDRVTLRLARGPLTIETIGRAEQDGAPGAWIRVRNVASKRELSGRVAADGVVHVAP